MSVRKLAETAVLCVGLTVILATLSAGLGPRLATSFASGPEPLAPDPPVSAQDTNLVRNGDFEDGFDAYGEWNGHDEAVGKHWLRYYYDTDREDKLHFLDSVDWAQIAGSYPHVEKTHGATSQAWVSSRAFNAGIYQQITGTVPGTGYTAEADMLTIWASSSPPAYPGKMIKDIGIDPYGGTWPTSTNVIWGEAVDQDEGPWRDIRTAATAMSTTITLFIRVQCLDDAPNETNQAWADDVILTQAPTATVSAPTCAEGDIPVSWMGYASPTGDNLTGKYDVQYRDGASGTWAAWLTEYSGSSATFSGATAGHAYYFRARAWQHYDARYDVDLYGDWSQPVSTTVDCTPPSTSAWSPPYTAVPTFTVSWSGADAGSGIAHYDVQFKPGAAGAWTDWQTNTTQTKSTFVGVKGETYYFRSRGTDSVGNAESYPAEADTHTTVTRYTLSGQITGNRGEAAVAARVVADPPALDTALGGAWGEYTLMFTTTGQHTLTVSAPNFGSLPPRVGVSVTQDITGMDFVLPPQVDVVQNGGFEGGLAGWGVGSPVTVTSAAAHTGHAGVWISGTATLSQTVYVSPTLDQPTLSFLYWVTSTSPSNYTFTVTISDTLHPLTLTVDGWTHAWFDASAFVSQTVAVRFQSTGSGASSIDLYLDEVSLGAAASVPERVFLPVITKQFGP